MLNPRADRKISATQTPGADRKYHINGTKLY